MSAPPSGWYGDPWGEAPWRWWNGHDWTRYVRLRPPGHEAQWPLTTGEDHE